MGPNFITRPVFIEKRQQLENFMFSSDWQLTLIADCWILMSDSTFKSAPKLFYQPCIIHGVIGERKLSLVWVLLKKQKNRYLSQNVSNLEKEETKKVQGLACYGSSLWFWSGGFPNCRRNRVSSNSHLGLLFPLFEVKIKKLKELFLFEFQRNDLMLNQFLRKFLAVGYLSVFYAGQENWEFTQTTNAGFVKQQDTQLIIFLRCF